jgi:hypothetical protein
LRAEDKEVDGLDLERETERQRDSELEKQDDEELPELQSADDRNAEHRDQVITAMRMILERDNVVVDELELPARELKALEALKAAVDGKDNKLSQFVYATDRKNLLEQALAVLQPNFVCGDAQRAQVLGTYHDLIAKVADLRNGLVELADSQDDLLHATDKTAMQKADGDKDDDDDDDDDAPKKSTLSDGPDVKESPKKSTLADGPEVKDEPATSTLADGPAAKDEPKGPTTLGDPADLAAAQKTPWWKRALGRE